MRTFASHCRLSKAGNNRSPFVVSCFVLLGSEFLPKLQPIAVGLIVVGFLVGLRARQRVPTAANCGSQIGLAITA